MTATVRKFGIALLAAGATLVACNATFADSTPNDPGDSQFVAAAKHKTVTVNADTEADASAQAAKKYPGWTVEKVKKTKKDPKSKAYQVTLTKQ